MEETPDCYYTAMAALCGAKIMSMFGEHMIIVHWPYSSDNADEKMNPLYGWGDTYSLWKGYGANSSTNAPIFRMECELVAQAVLWEMTRDVSTEDVCIRGVSPSSIERPARDAIEASRARYTHRARQDNRDGNRRIGRGLPRLAHSSLYVYIDWIWRKLATWKK